MRFSIIIPVYNVEKYIDKCMYTVMHQSFEDYEVIVVDDETPDHSMDIVQKYVEAFPGKIQVIHQKNTRQGGARNHGVRKAKGEYILFVDSDDYVHKDMLRIVDERIRENSCDILVFSHQEISESGEVIPVMTLPPPEGVHNPKEKKEFVLMACAPWKKAFRRDFYLRSGFHFPEKILYEDGVTRILYAEASSIAVCHDCLYYYVHHNNSSIRQKITEKMLDILIVSDLVIQHFQENNLYEYFRDPLDCALIYGILYILDVVNTQQWDHPIQKQMVDYISVHFPDYKENPWVDMELRRALDCLLNYNFRRYHYRFLVFNKFKDRLLQFSIIKMLNDWRKRK